MSEEIIHGIHAVTALLKNPHRIITTLIVQARDKEERIEPLLALAKERNIPIEYLPIQTITAQWGSLSHQGVLAKTKALPLYKEQDIPGLLSQCKQPALLLLLDGITDPHNLGACLRTADACGVDFVIIPKDKSAGPTPTVSKVASGALESIPLVQVTNLVRTIQLLQKEGVWVYGADAEASSSLYDLACTTPLALIMGAEGKGLRRLTKEHCDVLFSIPMRGTVGSLNVSVATGVSLYEVIRKRSLK